VVGTSTTESREHAIERWHLPHYMADLQIAFHEEDGHMDVEVRDSGAPVLDFSVTRHAFQPVRHLYNSFMMDGTDRFKVNIYMEGPHSEHEDERGELVLYGHPMTAALTQDEVASFPFREQWLKGGLQTFEELETI
jgi:hypothetical protein